MAHGSPNLPPDDLLGANFEDQLADMLPVEVPVDGGVQPPAEQESAEPSEPLPVEAEPAPDVTPITVHEEVAEQPVVPEQPALPEQPTEPDHPIEEPTEATPESTGVTPVQSVTEDEQNRLGVLRARGRVGVLTEGTVPNDTSDRLKNSDYPPEAVAAANKANREEQQRGDQDSYRADMISLYSRNPAKFDAMTTKEFVEAGREYERDGLELEVAENYAAQVNLPEKLMEMVDKNIEIPKVAKGLSKFVINRIANWPDADNWNELLIAAIKFEHFDFSSDDQAEEMRMLTNAAAEGHDIVSTEDIVKDWNIPPKAQLQAMADRIKIVTDGWAKAGQAAREAFVEKWGEDPANKPTDKPEDA